MIDQHRRGEGERIRLAERMALQEFKVGLLAPLPFGDCRECLDVPADELGQRRCTLLNASERRWILQSDLAMLGPGNRGGSVAEGSAFAMEDYSSAPYADDRGVARRSIGLPACFDRRHDESRGDKPFLFPLCLPGNR